MTLFTGDTDLEVGSEWVFPWEAAMRAGGEIDRCKGRGERTAWRTEVMACAGQTWEPYEVVSPGVALKLAAAVGGPRHQHYSAQPALTSAEN